MKHIFPFYVYTNTQINEKVALISVQPLDSTVMQYRSNSILAHIPQTADGIHIMKQAIFFTKVLGMRIFLMDVIQPGNLFYSNPKLRKNQERIQNELSKFTEFIKSALNSKIPDEIIPRIGWGKVVNTLIAESERGGYEFVIVDKSEKKNAEGLSRAKIDTYVSKSYCPVLLIDKDNPIDNIKKIVIPIDISQQIKKRLYWATFFAKKFDARIQIVSALNIDIKETRSLAHKNAEDLRKMLEERGVACEVKILKVLNREIHSAILEYIEKEKPGLVIIRTHQEIRFSGRKIGKFVSGIIHGCKIPVFTVGGVTQNFEINMI